jgi:hypothetical protein
MKKTFATSKSITGGSFPTLKYNGVYSKSSPWR